MAACLLAVLAGVAHAADPEEEARAAFGAGHYVEALALYQQLYRQTGHPTYLRNVGRCQQMLEEPTPALQSFREYLRIAPICRPPRAPRWRASSPRWRRSSAASARRRAPASPPDRERQRRRFPRPPSSCCVPRPAPPAPNAHCPR